MTSTIGTRWSLRSDIATVKAVAWLGGFGRPGHYSAEAHLYLYAAYWALAEVHGDAGRQRARGKAESRALKHWVSSGFGIEDPPPAGALALPIPFPPVFTDARSDAYWKSVRKRAS